MEKIEVSNHIIAYRYNILKFLEQNRVNVIKQMYAGSICFYYLNNKKHSIHFHVKMSTLTMTVPVHHQFTVTKGGDYYLFTLQGQAALLDSNQINWSPKSRKATVTLTKKEFEKNSLVSKLHLLRKESKMEKDKDKDKENEISVYKDKDEAVTHALDYVQTLVDEGLTIKIRRNHFAYYVLVIHATDYNRVFKYNIKDIGEKVTNNEDLDF